MCVSLDVVYVLFRETNSQQGRSGMLLCRGVVTSGSTRLQRVFLGCGGFILSSVLMLSVVRVSCACCSRVLTLFWFVCRVCIVPGVPSAFRSSIQVRDFDRGTEAHHALPALALWSSSSGCLQVYPGRPYPAWRGVASKPQPVTPKSGVSQHALRLRVGWQVSATSGRDLTFENSQSTEPAAPSAIPHSVSLVLCYKWSEESAV